MLQRVLQRHDDIKIIIPVPVDEKKSINVQKSRIEQNILPRSTIRATQERRYNNNKK